MRTIEGNISAFLSAYADRKELLSQDDTTVLHTMLYSAHDLSNQGYAYVGEVRIRIDMVEEDDILANQIRGLKREQEEVRVNSERRVMQIQERIDSLLALDYTPSPAADDIPF